METPVTTDSTAQQLPIAQPLEDHPAVINVVGLSYWYKRQLALAKVTFQVKRASIHGFVGPNGAGKTTALKILATLLQPPASALVQVGGYSVFSEYKKVRQLIGFMPDHFSMYRQMTVFEYLDFFGAAYGMNLHQRNDTIHNVLTLTDMEGRKDALVRSLSRGMQQRLSLARVLVHDPAVLLLDEPASGLDPRARIELMEILRELRRLGKTIFISSHILSELATLCDSFTIIDRGVIRYSGPKSGLLTREGCRSVVFSVAMPHPSVEDALGDLPGILNVARIEEDGAYRVTYDDTKVDSNIILRRVMDAPARLTSFQEDGGQLNQAFMDLTEPGVPV